MWFGDSVTLTEWPDIWLHEGFATWSEWIWSEHNGQKSAQHWFKTLYNTPAQDTAFWTPPPGDPGGPAFMFNGTIYNRGAMTLQALREKIGDTDFFELLAGWASQNRYGNVTTPEFIALIKAKIPMGRFLAIEEVAAMVAWIASPECSFTTGFCFDISGGRATY